MNEGQKQLYAYLRDNGLTDLDSNKFFSSYSDPSKSKEIHSYMKQNGLTDLDANAFHVAYFSPVKKKSTTGSQSVQKKKPTSSVTPVSWMQESLESSAKKEQPKKPSGPQVVKSNELKKEQTATNAGLTKEDVQGIASMGVNPMGGASGNIQPKKQEERDFDVYYGYPGQEKNEYRISNGRWERKYGEKWVEVSNQGSINSLTKFFKKQKEIANEEVFTGFPGKEENKYRVSELQNGQKVWEVQRAGQKDYTVIGDQGSVDALNRQFNKKVEYTDNAQLKREAEINRRESASEDFKTVTGKLVGKESDEVAEYLTKMYGDRGFRFQPVGTFTDRIRVSAEGTDRSEVFDLDNWRDDTDSAEALKLRKFLSENQKLGDYIDLEREEKKAAEEDVVGTQMTKESAEIQMDRLTGAGSQAEFKLAQKKNTEENIIKDLNKNSTEVIEARKLLIRADYDTKQRIDDLTRTAKTDYEKQELAAIAVANKDKFVENNRVDNDYLNDLNNSSKILDKSFNTLNSDVEEFNRYIKENNITQDQLEADPDLLAQKQELQVRYDQIIADAEDLDFENKKIPFIQNQNSRNAALYFAYNETRGSVIGGTWNGLLRGALGSLQTFRIIDKEGLDSLVETFGSSTTKEFTSSENRNDFSRALLSTSESLGAAAAAVFTGGLAAEGTVASKVLGFVPYFSVSYNEIKNEIDAIPGMNKVPWYKKEALSIAYGLGVGYLDKLSTDFQVKGKISNKIGRDLVLRSISGLPKGATAEAIEMAIASNFKKDIAAGVIKIVAGQVLEGTTEGVQSAYGTGLKEVYDWMNGVDEFDSREWVSQAFEEAYYGALGGAIMSTPSALVKGIKNGFGRLDPKDMELARKVIEDSNMRSMVITDIKTKLMSGEITKEEANAQMGAINESMSLFAKIPDNLSAEGTSKAMDLIKERSVIEKEIQGKDKDLVVSRTNRITEINNELKTISEDATKKSTEQEVTAEGGGVQREGAVEGQPEVGQGEGTVGQATEQGTDTGDSTVESRSQEEEIKKLRADEQAELTEAIPNIEEYKVDGEIDKASMPENVLAKYDEIYNKYDAKITPLLSAPQPAPTPTPTPVPVPTIAETTDTKTYSEALSAAKAELKAEGKGLDLQVSDVSQEEADAIVKEGGKIFMTEDGLAGAYVKKDGYMGGLFKSPRATYKEVAKLLQQARIKVGGKFMDAYATELEKIYVKNGFRPIARMKFNEEYAPEGWDAPGSALAGKPDVVFFAYDPEGKYKIGDGEYVEDYDAAYEMAKNFDAKTANEADKLAAILDKKATVSKGVISKEEMSKRVTLAQKALSAILPDVKFIVHDTDEAFRKAVGEINTKDSSAGAYDMGNKVIHINGTKANKRTVSHEVFHAIIISKAASDVQLQKLTANMVNSVLKSLKQTGTNQDVIEYLERFAAEYKDDPTVMNEEKLAELHGILGENMIELPVPTQNIIKRFLDRLAKMFGLKEMTDREAVEFMNTMSSKVETGKEITAKEFKASKTTIKDAVKRFQANFKDEVSGLEFVYDENGEKFADLEKNGFITKDRSITSFDGQYMFFHQPDAAFSGIIAKRNKKTGELEILVEGKGGMYYPIKFHENGYFWASTSTVAEKMAKDLNEAMKQNGGKLLMALTSAPSDKLLSSTTAANAVMDLISSKAFDRNFAISPAQLKNILINAAASTKEIKSIIKDKNKKPILDKNGNVQYKIKNIGLGIKIKKGDSLEDVKLKIKELLIPDASSFADRKTFVEAMIKESVDIINSNPKAIDQFGEFFSAGIQNKYFKGIRKKGYNISAANMKQALSEMLTEPMLKEGVNRDKGGQIYAVIELDGGIESVDSNSDLVKAVDSDLHESYPKAIQSVDTKNKVKLHILTDRVKWSDVAEDFETNDIVSSSERELELFPTSGVSVRALKINTKNVVKEEEKTPKAQIEEEVKTLEEEMEPKVRKQMAVEMQEIKDKSVEDGTFMKAPNGKKTKLDETQWLQVRTKAFKKWFGDWQNDPENASKVVDENGEPLVVFHYSPNEFTIFDKSKHPQFVDIVENKKHKPLGYDFSTKDNFYKSQSRNKEYKVFLNVRNVFDFRVISQKEIDKVVNILSKIPYYSNHQFQLDLDVKNLLNGDWSILERPTLEKYLAKNYDGLFMTENDWLNIKVFDPNQIKIADGTNTTFDPNESKFRKQIVGENANLAQNVRDNLDVARQMEAGKKSKKDVRIATGWERGADKKWRYEIDDNINDWIQGIIKNISSSKNIEADSNFPGEKNQSVSLNKLLPKIITESYPEINKMDINVTFDTSTNDSFYDGKKKINVGSKSPAMIFTIAYNLIHEIQHVIQGIEGFARGTSTNNLNPESKKYSELENEILNSTNYGGIGSLIYDLKQEMDKGSFKSIQLKYDTSNLALKGFLEKKNYDGDILNDDLRSKMLDLLSLKNKSNQQVTNDEYLRYAGEVEARNVEERASMTPEERRQTTLEETEDVSREDQIIFFEGSKFRKQKASKQAAVIVKKGKEANLSDAGIREYMKRNGYTDRQATDAIQAYNDKQEGIFIDPDWSKLRRAAVVFKRKFLSARGLMPNSAFALNENRQADIAKSLNMAEKTIVDFNRAMKKVAKNDRDQVRKDFDAYIRGDKTVNLPVDLKKVADTMRAHIDSMSESLINSGLVDEHTTEKITDNLGAYLTRSYKVYDRANWGKEVEAEIKQKAINFLKVQYTPMAQEIAAREGMDVDDVLDTIVTNKFNEILTKEGAENFITGGKMGSKNLSILKERQDIPLEIRMLMGEYTNPAQNYAKTILKMSALAANHQFLTEVKKNGTGVFLFEKNDPRRPKGFDYMIAAEGSETMNPLNGMYTTKEIKEEFEKQPAQLGAMMETYMRALSLVKWGKTIGSIMTHMKNVFGNLGFVLLNGHWRVNEMGRAYKTVKNDLFSRDKAGLRDYMNRLIELGIVKQSAGIGELRAMFKDADWDTAMIERINKKTGSRWDWVKSGFNKGTKFMEDLYQSEDDFFKIVAFENELSRYSKAMFGKRKTELTEEERAEVDKVVAEIVKNTYPTYSRIPELVNIIRRFPFVGNFISFQAESYRTAFNTAALSLDEIKSKNPGVRQIGAQRLIGSLVYMGGKTAILSMMSNAVGMGAVGILGYFTDDEEEKKKEDDVRKFVAPWSKNSDLIVLKAKNGKIQYIDFSSSDPHGGINKAINSALMGSTSVDGFINALGSVIEPFIGEEMTTAAILAVKNNKNAYGKPIYNPEDTFFEKSKDISAYMLNVVQPGTVSTARKMYESDSKLNEAVGAATGMRIYDVDVAESFGYSMITFDKRIDDANRIYTSEVYNKDATEKSIAAAKKRAEKAVTEIHAEIYDLYYSAVRLGADEDKLYMNLKSFGGMTKRTINYMFGQEDFYIKNKYPEEEEEE